MKKCTIAIGSVYYPPSDKYIQNQLTEYIKRRARALNRPRTHYLIMGDFNATADPYLDSTNPRTRTSELLNWLKDQNFMDTFRDMNGRERKFSWSNGNASSRIDYIWADHKFESRVLRSKIYSSEGITDSDHAIVLTSLDIFEAAWHYSNAKSRNERRTTARTVFLYDKMTPTQWENYSNELHEALNRNKAYEMAQDTTNEQALNNIWDVVTTSIQNAAHNNIPHRQIRNNTINSTFTHERRSHAVQNKRKDMLKLRKLIKTARSGTPRTVTTPETHNTIQNVDQAQMCEYNIFIMKMNTKLETDIPLIGNKWTQEWIEEAHKWLNIIRKSIKQHERAEREKMIKKNINARNGWILDNQKKMINSITEKPYKKIIIDRLRTIDEQGEEKLISDPEGVKQEAIATFKNTFRQRNHKFNNLPKEWEEIYEARADIEDRCFDDLDKEPTDEEWNEMLGKLNEDSAAGISGIGYKLIKKATGQTQKLFKKIAYMCYQCKTIPWKWKVSQMYPIPKPQDWNYNLAITRPIILLECLRKCTIKILTYRLGRIIKEHSILKGPNYAGLPSESTHQPIITINNILEDARDSGKTIWLISQDMAKAFDSVGMTPLRKALERIKIPTGIRDFIINIFEGRRISIITAYGLTESFEAAAGIDQGESISPLIWRIFYDPLLHRIQEDKTLGYNMQVRWPVDIANNTTYIFQERIAASAYADDTQWIAKSKEEAQKIIDISNSFFDINDIKINGDKSELLVINPET